MSVSNIDSYCFQRMNNRGNVEQWRGGVSAGDTLVLPDAPAKEVDMPVNHVGLTDAEVWASLDQMALTITMQAQAMTAQVNRKNVLRENTPVRIMADRLRDLTRNYPPIFTGSMIFEDPKSS